MDYFEDRVAKDRRKRRIRVGALILFAAVLTAGLYLFLRQRPGTIEEIPDIIDSIVAPAAPTAPAVEATPTVEPTPHPTLPPMEEETLDEMVRRVVGTISSHPTLVKWLATEGLVRRFVVAVDNVAEGKSPRQGLVFMDPRDDFEVSGGGDRIVIDPSSYRRYDVITEAVDSIDVDGVVAAFEELEPRIDEAYRQLGYPDRRFRDVLRDAIRRLLRVPVPRGEIEVRPKVKSYKFADERLEARSAAEKHLLRMGPENQKRVQRKLAEIADALGIR